MHSIQIGDVILDKYEITALLGQGGMGAVFAACHRELGELVALKFLLPELRNQPDVVARFAREARTATRIKNEHVARIRDVDTIDGVPFIVMEHLTGRDLANILAERRQLGVSEAADLLLQACEAVHEAHALGIVHRDLKPHNLFVTTEPDGTPFVKVLDFGISKSVSGGDKRMTTTTTVVGTPEYMSPDQLRWPKNVDARSDVWSLGVILYELVTGALPFSGDVFSEICAAILACEYRKPSSFLSTIPRELEKLILDTIKLRPEERVPSVESFAARLSAFGTEAGRASYARIQRTILRSLPPSSRSIAPAEAPVRTYRAGIAAALGVLAAGTGLAFAAPHLRSTSTVPTAPVAIVMPVDVATTAAPAVVPADPTPVAAAALPSAEPTPKAAPPPAASPARAASPPAAPAVATKSASANACVSGASPECAAACEGGSAVACNNVGAAYATGTGVARDASRAVGLYQRACEGGFAKACVNLGSMLYNGDGLPKTESLGARYFQRGCDAGEAAGCLNASIAYADGRGVPKDPGQAFQFAERACKGGSHLGCIREELARMQGNGVAKDAPTGLAHLDTLCANREPMACDDLARLYQQGVGADVPRDPARAGAYAKKACDLGVQSECQESKPRSTIEHTDTTHTDTTMARGNALFQSACDRGDPVGCAMLGKNFIGGIGMPADRERGMALLRKACDGGFADACTMVANGGVQ